MLKKMTAKEVLILFAMSAILVLFFYGLDGALAPLAFSWFLAYASLPLVKKMEGLGLTRAHATTVVLCTVLIGLCVFFLIIIPPLFSELHDAVVAAPKNLTAALERLESILSQYDVHIPYNRQTLIDFANHYSDKISGTLLKSIGSFLSASFINAASLIVLLLNIFLIPIFFIFVLNDYEQILSMVESFVPPAFRPQVQQIVDECDVILSGFIRGQLLVCGLLAGLYGLGLLIVGLKFGLIIGLLTGCLAFIPYVGFSFGLSVAIITALANFEGYGTLIGVGIVYAVVQTLESFVITPRIVGNKVGLSPFEAILALIVMGNVFGFMGLLLAIPAGAILKNIFKRILTEYKQTSFYKSH